MLIHRTRDNTFVILKDNLPYHVIPGFEEYQELLERYLKEPEAFEEETFEEAANDNEEILNN